ncbi:MAG: O-antigen ligase family protein [Bacillota bacterium]
MKILWLLTTISAFFGPTLSVPGYENIYAFRILLIIQIIGVLLYVFYRRDKLLDLVFVKEYLAFYGLWLCWAGLTFLWADSRADWMRHVIFLFTALSLIGFSLIHFQREKDIRLLIFIFGSIIFIFLGVCLFEHHFRYNVGVGGSAIFFERGVPNGFMANPNDLATFLTLYLPFLYCLVRYGNNLWIRIVGLVGIPLTFHVILLTRSRANLFSLGIMILAAIYFLKPWKNITKIKFKWIIPIGVFLALCIFMVSYSQEVWYFWAKERQLLANQFTSLEDSSSVTIRLTLLKQGALLLKEHYFLGVGAGNVEYHMAQFKDMTQGIVNMHNWWGEVLINYGVVLWGLYLFFFVKMIRDLFGVYQQGTPVLKMVSEALLISFSGYVLSVASSSTMAATSFMWILFALALVVINIHRSRKFFNLFDQ